VSHAHHHHPQADRGRLRIALVLILGFMAVEVVAGILASSLALLSHATKAGLRLAVNTSPEPASNVLASLAEDGLVAAVIWFAVTNPWLALTLVVVLLVAGTVLTVTLFAAARRAIRTRRERRAARRRAAGGSGRPRA
jgi:hypothetical protein